MKNVEYATDGEPIGDWQVMIRAKEFLISDATHISVGSELFIQAIRAIVHDRRFPHTEVQFMFKGTPIAVQRNGSLTDWPQGFCDMSDRLLDILLGAPPDSDMFLDGPKRPI